MLAPAPIEMLVVDAVPALFMLSVPFASFNVDREPMFTAPPTAEIERLPLLTDAFELVPVVMPPVPVVLIVSPVPALIVEDVNVLKLPAAALSEIVPLGALRVELLPIDKVAVVAVPVVESEMPPVKAEMFADVPTVRPAPVAVTDTPVPPVR